MFFFKQKTAYELRISDWSSDVCSSDLAGAGEGDLLRFQAAVVRRHHGRLGVVVLEQRQQGVGRGGAACHMGQMIEEAAAVERQVGVFVVEIDDQIGSASCRERVCPYV